MNLSVAVPAYNQGKFLGETIESLLNQKQAPFEVVVSDNHSTDETAEVLSQFRDRVRCLRPPEHLTAHAHFDFIISQLEGDWISLLSSDDVAKSNFVETLVRGSQHVSDAVLVRANYETIDESGKRISVKTFKNAKQVVSPPETFYEQLKGPRTSFCAFAIRKRSWKSVNGFGETAYLLGDWAFWIKISLLGSFVYEPEVISQYRVNYRPDIEQIRMSSRVDDEIRIREELIPSICRKIENADIERVENATRERCYQLLVHLSKNVSSAQRHEYGERMSQWAQRSNLESALSDFLKGKVLYRKNYGTIRRSASRLADVTRKMARSLR